MEKEPRALAGAHWKIPERQVAKVKVFKRVGLKKLTPVFGTAQPPRGLSGLLRAGAYRIPETKAVHWAALLVADRIDVLEGLILDSFKRGPSAGFWMLAGRIGWFPSRALPRTPNRKRIA